MRLCLVTRFSIQFFDGKPELQGKVPVMYLSL
jgi:hypothetical protein